MVCTPEDFSMEHNHEGLVQIMEIIYHPFVQGSLFLGPILRESNLMRTCCWYMLEGLHEVWVW